MKKLIMTVFLAVLLTFVLGGCEDALFGRDENPLTPNQSASGVQISEQKAKETALEHANLEEKDVTMLRVQYDFDDGIKKYEVEFDNGGYEYSYEINAESGEIIQNEREPIND